MKLILCSICSLTWGVEKERDAKGYVCPWCETSLRQGMEREDAARESRRRARQEARHGNYKM